MRITKKEYFEAFDQHPQLGDESDYQYSVRIGRILGRNRVSVYRPLMEYKRSGGAAAPDDTQDQKQSWQEGKIDAVWEYRGEAADIQTLEQAIAFSGVDLNDWEVDRHVFNKWDTTMKLKGGEHKTVGNIQVKVWFKRRIDHGVDWDVVMEKVRRSLASHPHKPRYRSDGDRVGVIVASDFHFGAYVDDLLRSDDFNISVLQGYLETMADQVNAENFREVHLALLGDFIESFTGLNHRNSWKGLGKGMFGMNAVILCFEVLYASLISKLKNLESVNIVSGNHDRISSDADLDPKGEVSELLAYMIAQQIGKGRVHFHPLVLSREIDGMVYVMTHGHHGLSKREITKVLFDYGQQGMYNLLLQGHLHTRKTIKSSRRNQFEVGETLVTAYDESDYRMMYAPALFTGNFYSESLGYSSSAGYLQIENNGNGRPWVTDRAM